MDSTKTKLLVTPAAAESSFAQIPKDENKGFCCRRGSHKHDKEILKLGCGPDNHRIDNKVITAKYNVLTFVPYSFVNQFRHFSNAYFLIIFVIAIIGDSNFSSLNWYQSPLEATGFLLSLAVVVAIAMGFDLAYDIGRHLEDRKVNNRIARRINQVDEIEKVPWHALRPGDIIVVARDERFPADLLFLESRPSPLSQQDDFDSSRCYVETSNIDGETNLKVRFAPGLNNPSIVQTWWQRLGDWNVVYDLPKPALEFSGLMTRLTQNNEVDVEENATNEIALDFSNLLLRESVLKNTHEVVGVVLYAGKETKGVQSSSATRTKVSNAVKLVNRAILVILFVGLIMVLISAGISSTIDESPWYLKNPPPYVFGSFWSPFFTYVILYSNLLPISLVIATTITNFIQAQFVNWDAEMYDATKDRPARCATLDLAQEIGQVSFVFSDKTGTLTRNEMKFVGCSTGLDHCFGLGERMYETSESDRQASEIFEDLLRLVRSSNATVQRENARLFLTILAVCHTVLVEGTGNDLTYNAEGPDEEALVNGVSKLGFVLSRNTRSALEVVTDCLPLSYDASGESRPYRFEILGLNHFDSTRKRMSVVVRLPNGGLELMVKGADSVMFERLSSDPSHEEERVRARIGEHLNNFAANGLRTLVIARRSLTAEEVSKYLKDVSYANAQLGEEKLRLIGEAADALEQNLSVVGASAIEDRLQEGVPETLKCLRDAGIKTWVLTGDKVETAINIGHSAGLLTNEMQLIELTSSDKAANMNALESLGKAMDPKSLNELQKLLRKGSRKKLFSPTRKTRGVSLGVEATGEDPFGMGTRTKQAVGNVVENGFHAFTAAYEGSRKAIRHGMHRSRHSLTRMNSKETSEANLISHHKRAASTQTPVAAADDSTLPASDDDSLKFNFAAGTDANTSFEGVTTQSEDTLGHSLDESLREPIPDTVSMLVRQTSTVIPPDNNFEASHLALVVSGAALHTILHDPKLVSKAAHDNPGAPVTDEELKFLSVAKVCKVVIACRVSPRQKALLVRLVRKGVRIGGKEPITLAIGDGQNDVAMIQESRVGVGVAGREGSQAVNAADFSIGQFRFLRRLLLVHGRWNYRRMALLVLFIFYAHIIPVVVAFAFNFLNMWSGTSPFPLVWIIAYSYIVVIPCIFLAAFNRDISATTAFKYPSIYVSGRANLHMGRFKILEYVFKSIAHATIICAFVYAAFAMPTLSYLDLGTLMYWCILLIVLSRLALECFTWTIISVIVYILCLMVFPILEVIIYGSDSSLNTIWGTTVLFGPLASYIWLVAFFIMMGAVVFDLSLSLGRRVFFPNLIDIVIEIDRGYAPNADGAMNDAAAALDILSRPQELPREAVSKAVDAAESVSVAPKFRSAYAQDVLDGQTVDGMSNRRASRFARFSLKAKQSFTLRTKRKEENKTPTAANTTAVPIYDASSKDEDTIDKSED